MVQKRSIVTAILLSLVTCGIYGLYWLIKLNDEINTVGGTTEDTSGVMVLLLTLVTCGIYGWIWMYKTGEKLDKIAETKGQKAQSRGILYIILALCGLSIVSYALMQDALNNAID